MQHREIQEGLKGWAADKARQVATSAASKVSKTAKTKKEIEDRYQNLLDELKTASGRLKGKLTVGKFMAWLQNQGISSSAIAAGFKDAGYQLTEAANTTPNINKETQMNWDTIRSVLRNIIGHAEEKGAGFSSEIEPGTEFKIRGRLFQWSGNQWVEASGTDELGDPDFSKSGNIGKKTQKRITQLYRDHGGKEIPGEITKPKDPMPTSTTPSPSVAKATTAAELVQALNNLSQQEKEKFTQAFLNAMGARGA